MISDIVATDYHILLYKNHYGFYASWNYMSIYEQIIVFSLGGINLIKMRQSGPFFYITRKNTCAYNYKWQRWLNNQLHEQFSIRVGSRICVVRSHIVIDHCYMWRWRGDFIPAKCIKWGILNIALVSITHSHSGFNSVLQVQSLQI
jgi:hypothetical protein